ncbi:TRAP transporter substrate-binding protein [Azospirillum sp. RWY-5-1]|uniref:TRAP transporter substrate-binding protein n=1 Tax=Azospirillum oleiclasticum TaxID=2735135 RepID=A0ABX2T9J5_9PROT|nr:TRAP transporter substrate-binding protein [Azospirillum oleiclasticum]NYZ13724.1 TRAP transporter substrate-binding protein [Azospirillum oleiclasticum]NYZ20996.1 TRAP transporter substrate-binding protein [Azospirillum oleiclasticum]
MFETAKSLLLAAGLCVVGTTGLFTVGSAAQAADIGNRNIRFGYGLNEDSVQGRATAFFAEEVKKLSGGKMKVSGFGASTLGSDMQMQTALVGGVQEMMVGSTATLVGTVKEFGVFDFPFLFNNEKEADAVLDGPFGTKLLNKLEDKGLVALVYWENGFRNLTNKRRPVEKVEDLSGIKLRVMQNQVALEVFKSLGTNAVPMPFSELFSALETGVVDGQENPVATIQSSKFYEVQPYLTLTKHVYSPWVVMASKKWWDKLTNDEKDVIRKAAIASRDFERKDNRAGSEASMEALKKAGMKINAVSDAELDRMRAKVQPVIDHFSKEYGEELTKELMAEIKKARG